MKDLIKPHFFLKYIDIPKILYGDRRLYQYNEDGFRFQF